MKIFLVTPFDDESMEALVRSGHKNVLGSFYYLRKFGPEKREKMKQWIKDNNICFLMDSGVFSLREDKKFFKIRRTKEELLEFYTKFTKEYFQIVQDWYDVIYQFAEMDIDSVIGFDEVKKLRNLLPAQFQGKMCAVHHPDSRTNNDFLEDSKKYHFMGLGTSMTKDERRVAAYGSFVKHIQKNGNRIHGFALVDTEMLNAVPFNSADSNSWKSGVMYGILFYFDKEKKKVRSFRYKNSRELKKHYDELAKLHPQFSRVWESGSKDKSSRIFKLTLNAMAFNEMQEYLTNLWNLRGINTN